MRVPSTVATIDAGIATLIDVASASLSPCTPNRSLHHSSVQQVNSATWRSPSSLLNQKRIITKTGNAR